MATRSSELRKRLTNPSPSPVPLERTAPSDPSPFSSARKRAEPSSEQVAIAAYYRAQARNFEPGHEIEDWLEAERELAMQGRESQD